MTGYELVFITNPDLNEEDLGVVLEKAKETLTKEGGTLIYEYLWGRRRLAYEISGKTFGVYHAWYFTGTGETVNELNRQFGYSDEIIRNQTIATEDLEGDASYFKSLMEPEDEEDQKKPEVVVQKTADEAKTEAPKEEPAEKAEAEIAEAVEA